SLPISAKMPKSSLPLHRGPRNVQPGIAAQRSSTNFGTSPFCTRVMAEWNSGQRASIKDAQRGVREEDMNRNVTAIYRTHAVADLVRQELEAEGLSRSDIHVIPDHDRGIVAADDDDRRYFDAIHDLNLPDADARTYEASVRRGDYIVSVDAGDDRVDRIQAIMRRPEAEAYNIDDLDAEFSNYDLLSPRDPMRGTLDPALRGERDPAYTNPDMRSYRRRSPDSDY
ncbi:hypothetical protein, partial [Aurantimonas sp. C2-4-R8]|nr:hypothetical protein [Aurantimonas sp. C2-4-R8]